MEISKLLDQLPAIISKLLDGIKLLVAGFFIHRNAKLEARNDASEKKIKIMEQQHDIAARPPSHPSSLRDRMRKDEL